MINHQHGFVDTKPHRFLRIHFRSHKPRCQSFSIHGHSHVSHVTFRTAISFTARWFSLMGKTHGIIYQWATLKAPGAAATLHTCRQAAKFALLASGHFLGVLHFFNQLLMQKMSLPIRSNLRKLTEKP